MATAGTIIPLDSSEGMDKITTTEKITTPYFSNGETTLAGTNIRSSSLSDTNENYFFGISHADTLTTEEFNVTFGSTNGYGSAVGTNKKSRTEAIYKQFASMLLAPSEVTGGFIISSPGSSPAIATGKDSEIFVLMAKRSQMKDRLNKGNWTIALSGSTSAVGGYVGATQLFLTDDSVDGTPTATPAGNRYNVVSGSDGTVVTAASVTNYGYFYPDAGIVVLSGAELSASIPGALSSVDDTVIFRSASQNGFGTPSTQTDSKQALRFLNCVSNPLTLTPAGSLKFRDEEDQVSAQYFCRVRSGHCNFSNNPTFVSGSQNKLRNSKMRGNPQTFITGVQLYNDANEIIAVANLSTPLKKNFSSEATIKVKLTY
tara:strand:+ start:889 stop:2004 length:1116 start_codon:yes stop_codon:yes gene_type:complete